jgi:hypothetical protein
MARHPVAVQTKQRPPGNNRAPEASDDEGRKKRCTVPSPQREAVSGAEQALRDYEDYLCYYGLKEYCTPPSPYVDYSDCVERLGPDATNDTVEAASSDDDEPSQKSDAQSDPRDVDSDQGDDESPDHLTASVVVDAPVPAREEDCTGAAPPPAEGKAAEIKADTPLTLTIPQETTSWGWALASVGHVRGPSTSSSCTADSEGAASCASSWAKVLTPLPRRKCGSVVDNEWEVVQVLAPDEESSSFV